MNTLTGLPRSLHDLAMTKDFIIWGGVAIRPQKFLILAGAEKNMGLQCKDYIDWIATLRSR